LFLRALIKDEIERVGEPTNPHGYRVVTVFRVDREGPVFIGSMSNQDSRRLLRRSEVAGLLNMSRRQVDRLTQSGAIAVVRVDRVPRYRPADVEAFIRAHRVGGRTP
jgi:predicted DNA-binding transcriptional regulator AlpA